MAHARSGLSCIRCGREDGTVCGRHYNGIRQHMIGKGRGIKGHPIVIADFCNCCDAEFQEGTAPKNDHVLVIEYSEEFLFWCAMSAIRRERLGIVRAA